MAPRPVPDWYPLDNMPGDGDAMPDLDAAEQQAAAAHDWEEVQRQAYRYMVACYGTSFVFKAPETFPNLLERWLIAVAAGNVGFAEDCMVQIEEMAAAQRGD